MKVVTVVGTRPNFVKEFAIAPVLQQAGAEEVLVHTGQHYDYEMSQVFFNQLELPRPRYLNNIVKSGFHGDETAVMLQFIEQVLLNETPDVTLVYGDVNSTVAAALASVKLRIPVAHVEAGLRCDHFYNPEEINRRVTDAMSEVLFPHIESAHRSLVREGYDQSNVFLTGDVVMDSLVKIVDRAGLQVSDQGYNVMTVHRSENTDDRQRLTNIIQAVVASGQRTLFSIHPRTRRALVRYGLMDVVSKARCVEEVAPAGYLDFVKLLAGAHKVVTDSGGVRREAYILRKPVINISELVWVPEMVEAGWSVTVRDDPAAIQRAIRDFTPPDTHPGIFGNGHAAERIVDVLVRRYAGREC
ncbi:MAG: UDP-N-acetylglucosamine 2-epimerase (non-hydrolyzing) [Candidatus Latescibacterota bacterium]